MRNRKPGDVSFTAMAMEETLGRVTGHRRDPAPFTLPNGAWRLAPRAPARWGAQRSACRLLRLQDGPEPPNPAPAVDGLTSSNLHQAEKEISHIKKYLCHLQPNGNSKACLPVSGKGTYKRPGEISYLDGASAQWRMLVPGEGTRAFDKWRL